MANRKTVTQRVLDRIFSVKLPTTDVIAVVAPNTGFEPHKGLKTHYTHGEGFTNGEGKKLSMQVAASYACYGKVLFIDNDILLMESFDSYPLDLLSKYETRHPQCVASPVHHARGNMHAVERRGEYYFSRTCSGQAVYMKQNMIKGLLKNMPDAFWTGRYDFAWCGWIHGVIHPLQPFARHIGRDKESLNTR